MKRPPSRGSASLAFWRDVALTAAAFSFVLASVIGLGPFNRSAELQFDRLAGPDSPPSTEPQSPPRFADLSR